MGGPSAALPCRVYAYARCGTCRKALAWLDGHGIPYELVDITRTPPSAEELRRALQQLGSRSRLFHTSGLSYRSLGAARVKAMEEAQAIAALAEDGKLVKRPFLITPEGLVTTGFSPAEWADLLGVRP